MTPFALQPAGNTLRLSLAGDITIEHAKSLATELKSSLRSDQTLEVDASQLNRLDAAGLQVLLACAQFAADTTLSAASTAWTDAFARYASSDPFRLV